MNVFGPRLSPSLLFLCSLAAPSVLQEQASPLVLEIHGGASVPVSSFADGARVGEGTAAAGSFGLDLAFSGSGWRTLYVGFSQHRFGCQDAGCSAGTNYIATGFDVGLRFNLWSTGPVAPWIRLGAVTTRVEVPSFANIEEGVSALGLGGEVGIGLYIGTSSPIALVPGIRATAVNTKLPGGSLLHMRYVVADLALALSF